MYTTTTETNSSLVSLSEEGSHAGSSPLTKERHSHWNTPKNHKSSISCRAWLILMAALLFSLLSEARTDQQFLWFSTKYFSITELKLKVIMHWKNKKKTTIGGVLTGEMSWCEWGHFRDFMRNTAETSVLSFQERWRAMLRSSTMPDAPLKTHRQGSHYHATYCNVSKLTQQINKHRQHKNGKILRANRQTWHIQTHRGL